MKCYRCQNEKDEKEFDGKKSCRDCREKRFIYSRKWLSNLSEASLSKDEKRCNRCKVIKKKSSFNKGQDKCIGCEEYCKEYYGSHKENEIKRALKSYNKKPRDVRNEYKRLLNRKNPVNYMLQSARTRAKKLGLPFNLTKEDIVIPEFCPILGYKLQISDKLAAPNSPSLDRIVPEKGYVKGNVQVISWRANDVKGNATLEELKKMIDYLEPKKSFG